MSAEGRAPAPVALAIVVAFDAAGEPCALVQRRRSRDALAGLWEFPGGKIEAGETTEAAAVRELREETGLHARAIRTPATLPGDGARPELRAVLCELLSGGGSTGGGESNPASEDRDGTAETAWVPLGRLAELEMPPANAALLALMPPDAILE